MKSTKLWEARGSMICYLESKSKFPHRLNISLWSLHDLKHAKPHGAWVRILLKIKLLTSLICGVQQSRGSWSSNRPSIHSGCHSRPSFPRAQPLALGPSSASGWFAACLLECHSHVPSCMESPAEKASIGQVWPGPGQFRLQTLGIWP